jgi:hypothetical protein
MTHRPAPPATARAITLSITVQIRPPIGSRALAPAGLPAQACGARTLAATAAAALLLISRFGPGLGTGLGSAALSLAGLLGAVPPAAAQVRLAIRIGPPPLPLFEQPPLVGEDLLWLPGYWAWNPADADYFWVPGTWAPAPRPGELWTPGWWSFDGGAYLWRPGYWSNQVGFYGGIDYGFGYSGYGYQGGRWEGQHFHYNASVNSLGSGHTRHVYRSSPMGQYNVNRASVNGGPGGVIARATPAELQQQGGRRTGPSAVQQQHEQQAMTLPGQRQQNNRGSPALATTPRPAQFGPPGRVGAPPPGRPAAAALPSPAADPRGTPPGAPGRQGAHPPEHPPEPQPERAPAPPPVAAPQRHPPAGQAAGQDEQRPPRGATEPQSPVGEPSRRGRPHGPGEPAPQQDEPQGQQGEPRRHAPQREEH